MNIFSYSILFVFLAIALFKLEDVDVKFEKDTCSSDDTIPIFHAFYYVWYGNPETDNEYIHWNHRILPSWNSKENEKYKIGEKYNPKINKIGSIYYPKRGTYSSRDKETIRSHFLTLLNIGVNCVSVSYWGRNRSDGDGKYFEDRIFRVFEIAEEVGMKISFHLEPFWNQEENNERKIEVILEEIKFLHDSFKNSSSLLRIPRSQFSNNKKIILKKDEKFSEKKLPLFYIYDSYLLPSNYWNRILNPEETENLRNTEYDSIFIGLYLNKGTSEKHILESHFDGFYSYFASIGFTYGSTIKNWKELSLFAIENDLFFVPSVGPGYDDTKIRPWNKINVKDRNDGKYYRKMLDEAIKVLFEYNRNSFISITSFNEWGEGTQIEECLNDVDVEGYKSYKHGEKMYLKITQEYINIVKKKKN